ncbi:MAG: peptidase M23, partial [Phaeobacter gallaeciensis]
MIDRAFRLIPGLALCLLMAAPLRAETAAARAAREAAAQLEAATLRMEQADGARDRVKALSETI